MIKFLLFSDFHYQKSAYPTTLNDIDVMLKKANEENVDFCIQCGDFCTDGINNLEVYKAYQQNKYDLPCYGIIGNHELEGSSENTMELITPTLCNRKVEKPYPEASYWYTDIKGIRLIGLDSNHSYNPQTKQWEHTPPGRTGARPGNTHVAHVHPAQMEWLKNTLDDAKEKGLKAILFSHHALSGAFNFNCGNGKEIRDLLENYKKTAVMCICGDLHADLFTVINKVAYYCITATRFLADSGTNSPYPQTAEFDFIEYDEKLNPVKTYKKSVNSLSKCTYRYSDSPLYAIVTIADDGSLTINGTKAGWLCSVAPDESAQRRYPYSTEIKDRYYKLDF